MGVNTPAFCQSPYGPEEFLDGCICQNEFLNTLADKVQGFFFGDSGTDLVPNGIERAGFSGWVPSPRPR
jgi:hypothetical protein